MRYVLSTLAILIAAGAALPAAARTDQTPQLRSAVVVPEVRCPVTGAVVQDVANAAKSDYKGATYAFCCPGCKPMFDADPAKYVGQAKPRASAHVMAGPPSKQ